MLCSTLEIHTAPSDSRRAGDYQRAEFSIEWAIPVGRVGEHSVSQPREWWVQTWDWAKQKQFSRVERQKVTGQIGLKRSRWQSPVNLDSWLRNGSLGGTSQGNPLFLTKGAAYPPNSRPRTLWKNPASWDLSLAKIRIPLTLAHTSYSHKREAKIRN